MNEILQKEIEKLLKARKRARRKEFKPLKKACGFQFPIRKDINAPVWIKGSFKGKKIGRKLSREEKSKKGSKEGLNKMIGITVGVTL